MKTLVIIASVLATFIMIYTVVSYNKALTKTVGNDNDVIKYEKEELMYDNVKDESLEVSEVDRIINRKSN